MTACIQIIGTVPWKPKQRSAESLETIPLPSYFEIYSISSASPSQVWETKHEKFWFCSSFSIFLLHAWLKTYRVYDKVSVSMSMLLQKTVLSKDASNNRTEHYRIEQNRAEQCNTYKVKGKQRRKWWQSKDKHTHSTPPLQTFVGSPDYQ